MEIDDEGARYQFSRMLEEHELEYATDPMEERFVIPTAAGQGIVVEFFELELDERTVTCAALILPLLRDVSEPSVGALAYLSRENCVTTFGRFLHDEDRRVVEVRWDVVCDELSADSLLLYLGALSQHGGRLEVFEHLFAGRTGPTYDELLDGE